MENQSQKIQIKTGSQTHEVEGKPITLVVPAANMAAGPPLEYPGRVPIDFEASTYHGDRVKTLHHSFPEAWDVFARGVSSPEQAPKCPTPDSARAASRAMVHLLGLIDLSLKLVDQGVPIVWVYPETNLHPAWQVALGDLTIYFSKRIIESPKLPSEGFVVATLLKFIAENGRENQNQ